MKLVFCPLFSGSGGNSTFVASPNTQLLVDAGMSALSIGRALSGFSVALSQINGVLITHEHTDHVKGIATMARRYGVPVYANEKTWLAMKSIAAQVPASLIRVFENGRDFYIGDIAVTPFPSRTTRRTRSDSACIQRARPLRDDRHRPYAADPAAAGRSGRT